MGSSLARAALRGYGMDTQIIAIDPDVAVRKKALSLGQCVSTQDSLENIPQDCDWIILSAPVSTNLSLLKSAIAQAGPNCKITDLGSTKHTLTTTLEDAHSGFDRFIPAHPMAGREVSGVEHGLESLFDNKLVILTPPKTVAEPHIKAAESFYQKLGARTLRMNDAAEHDRLMGYASHLPHLLAFAFVNLAGRGNNGQTDYQDLTGAGYRDFTRIAASDPIMWQDIFLSNKDNIIAQLDGFSSIVDIYRKAILSEDRCAITSLIGGARDERKRLQQIIERHDI